MSIKTNLIVDQGTDFVFNVYLIDVNGNPFDLTGYTANAQIRRSYTANTFYNIDTTVLANAGLIFLHMSPDTTSLLTETRYVYDLDLYSSSNNTSRIIEGIVNVNPGVTFRNA